MSFSWLDAEWLLLEVGQAQFSHAARVCSYDATFTRNTRMLSVAGIAAMVPDARGEVLVRRCGAVLRPTSRPASDEVVGVSYTSDVPRQIFFDAALDSIHSSVAKTLSGQVMNVLSWTRDRSAATLSAASPGASETF